MARQRTNFVAPHGRSDRSSRLHRRGLSFVELSIGIAITGVLMLALAGFTLGVETGWRHSGDEAKVRSLTTRTGEQLQQAISGMLNVVQVKSGSTAGQQAYLFYWQNDAATGTADGKAQFGEMGLIEYDPATKSIWKYQVKPQSSMTTAQKTTANNDNWGDPTSAAIVTYFKSSDIVLPRTPIVGGTPSTSGGIDVTSATFGYYAPSGAKPLVIYQMGLQDTQTQSISSGNVALRSSQKPTNLP